MSVLHHTRFQLHLIWNGSTLFHDCTGPPLWLITAAITDHQYVTHWVTYWWSVAGCKLAKLSVHAMTLLLPGLFYSHLPSQIRVQQAELSADGMSQEQQGWRLSSCGMRCTAGWHQTALPLVLQGQPTTLAHLHGLLEGLNQPPLDDGW